MMDSSDDEDPWLNFFVPFPSSWQTKQQSIKKHPSIPKSLLDNRSTRGRIYDPLHKSNDRYHHPWPPNNGLDSFFGSAGQNSGADGGQSFVDSFFQQTFKPRLYDPATRQAPSLFDSLPLTTSSSRRVRHQFFGDESRFPRPRNPDHVIGKDERAIVIKRVDGDEEPMGAPANTEPVRPVMVRCVEIETSIDEPSDTLTTVQGPVMRHALKPTSSFKRRRAVKDFDQRSHKWIDDFRNRFGCSSSSNISNNRAPPILKSRDRPSPKWRHESGSRDWAVEWDDDVDDDWCNFDLGRRRGRRWMGPLSSHLDFEEPFRCLDSRPVSIIIATTDASDGEASNDVPRDLSKVIHDGPKSKSPSSSPPKFTCKPPIHHYTTNVPEMVKKLNDDENSIPIKFMDNEGTVSPPPGKQHLFSSVQTSTPVKKISPPKNLVPSNLLNEDVVYLVAEGIGFRDDVDTKRHRFHNSRCSDLTHLQYPVTNLKRRPPVDKRLSCGKYRNSFRSLRDQSFKESQHPRIDQAATSLTKPNPITPFERMESVTSVAALAGRPLPSAEPSLLSPPERERHNFYDSLTSVLEKGDVLNNRSFEEEDDGLPTTATASIDRGNSPKASSTSTPTTGSCKRRNNIRWRSKLSELIWLELRAWRNGTSLREEDEALSLARDRHSDVLGKVCSFRIQANNSYPSDPHKLGLPGHLGLPGILVAVNDENERVVGDAFLQVGSLLTQLDEFEALFPHSKSISKDYPLYSDRNFCVRVKTLCLWYNINRVLQYKVRAMGDILYLNLFPSLKWPFRTVPPSAPTSPAPENGGGTAAAENPDPDQNDERAAYSRFDSYSSFSFWDSLSSTQLTSSDTGIYRLFIEKSVRQGPLSKVIFRLTKLLHATLQKTRAALNGTFPHFEHDPIAPPHQRNESYKTDGNAATGTTTTTADSNHKRGLPDRAATAHDDKAADPDPEANLSVHNLIPFLDSRYGCWSQESDYYKNIQQYGVYSPEFRAMQLPTFRTTFLFVCRIPLDIVHEWLRLRIEQKPTDLSFLSANQLMRECKEVLKAAVLIRHYYCSLVKAIFTEGEEIPEPCLKKFDDELKCMLSLYLQYLEKLVMLTPENTDHTQVSILEQEWKFIKMICPYILDKEVEASKKICALISKLVETIVASLKEGVDECLEHFRYWWQLSSRSRHAQGYQHYNSLNSTTTVCSSPSPCLTPDDNNQPRSGSPTSSSSSTLTSRASDDSSLHCASDLITASPNEPALNSSSGAGNGPRDFRAMFTEAKERSCKILGLTRVLRQDLEFAATYDIVPGKEHVTFQRLFTHGFVSLSFTHQSPPPYDNGHSLPDKVTIDPDHPNNKSLSSAYILRCSSPTPTLVRVTSKKRPLTSKTDLSTTTGGLQRSVSFRKFDNDKAYARGTTYSQEYPYRNRGYAKNVETIQESSPAQQTSRYKPPMNSSNASHPTESQSIKQHRPIPLQKFDSVPTCVPSSQPNTVPPVSRDNTTATGDAYHENTTQDELPFWVFIPKSIAKDTRVISKLLNMDCHREHSSHIATHPETDVYEFMIFMKCPQMQRGHNGSSVWPGKTFYVDVCPEIWKSFRTFDQPGLVILGKAASILAKQRNAIEKILDDSIQLSNPQMSFHTDVNVALTDLRASILSLQGQISTSTTDMTSVIEEMNEELRATNSQAPKPIPNYADPSECPASINKPNGGGSACQSGKKGLAIASSCSSAYEQKLRVKESLRDILALSFDLGFEYFRDSVKTISPCCPLSTFSNHGPLSRPPHCSHHRTGERGTWEVRYGMYLPEVAEAVCRFAVTWCGFAIKNYEQGHGRKPRWALQGLNFLKLASDPHITCFLSPSGTFKSWSRTIFQCVNHIIGQAPSTATSSDSAKRSIDKEHAGVHFNHMGDGPEVVKVTPHLNRFLSDNTQLDTYHEVTIENGLDSGDPDLSLAKVDPETEVLNGYLSQKLISIHHGPHKFNQAYHRNLSWPLTVPNRNRRDEGSMLDTVKLCSSDKIIDNNEVVNDASHNLDGDKFVDLDDGFEKMLKIEKVRIHVAMIDEERQRLLMDRGVIGRVSEKPIDDTFIHISSRKVHFRWQRGIKIGQGQSGKVYTAVNMENGELMAMKEIRLHPNNDHQIIKEVADEIKLFENVRHSNLVRYYGIEIHREEMLIFMEYCGGGTLEDAARTGQLPEFLIRKYTRELLLAVNHLHDVGIVHRDIKGANIYLCSNMGVEKTKCKSRSSDPTTNVESGGPMQINPNDNLYNPNDLTYDTVHNPQQHEETASLKLGDFGSAAKLKNFFTVPGEIKGLVGTPPFMAPEVINRCEGNGRAADIWSLGCVVIQMLAGRPPWSELENMFQIMYKVGSGQSPSVPENASEELVDFLHHCFEVDTRIRWSAAKLLEHPFPKGGKII